jgi:DNA processing protein
VTAGAAGSQVTPVAGESEAHPYAAALAGLPGAGPAILTALLQDWSPEEAWRRIQAGRLQRPRARRRPGPGQMDLDLGPTGGRSGDPSRDPMAGAGAEDESWSQWARKVDPPRWWGRHAGRGIGVTWPGQPDYPAALRDDPERPGVLFWRGSLPHLTRPSVAIVGTRRATPDGRAVAFELGRDLAAAGICVVSGLALGIDGAAHAGALRAGTDGEGSGAAGPAGVAASGVDVPYPRRHATLWQQVVQEGVLLSETLPGRPAQAWRFPARNRIIAGLVRMVVVVESHAAGGSLITADAAVARGIDVRVVPGPVHSPASAGSNQLLYDGPGPVRDARDVLDGLGIFRSDPVRAPVVRPAPADRADQGDWADPADPAAPAGPDGAASRDSDARGLLEAVSWRPTSLTQAVARSGLSVASAARALDDLEAAGLVGRHGDWWVRRRVDDAPPTSEPGAGQGRRSR